MLAEAGQGFGTGNFTLSGALRLFENSLGLLLIDQNTLIDEGPRKQAGSLSLQPAHMMPLTARNQQGLRDPRLPRQQP